MSNSIQVFGQIVRLDTDPRRPDQGYAELVDVGHTPQSPSPEFTLIAFRNLCERLMECQVGDLVLVTGHISSGRRDQRYKIVLTDVQRLVFDGEEPPPQST